MAVRAILLGAALLAAAANAQSCAGRCFTGFDPQQPCQCDNDCKLVIPNDCCTDYDTVRPKKKEKEGKKKKKKEGKKKKKMDDERAQNNI